MLAGFERCNALFHFSHTLVEIPSRCTHHHKHASSVTTLLTTYFFQPIKTLLNRVAKRRNILADRDKNVRRHVDRFVCHEKNIP
jgi:hypothetical protein